jgi:hypothetical protein
VLHAGAAPALLAVLRSYTQDYHAQKDAANVNRVVQASTLALVWLMFHRPEAVEAAGKAGATEVIISAFRNGYKQPGLAPSLCIAVTVLSMDPSHANALIDAGVMELLVSTLQMHAEEELICGFACSALCELQLRSRRKQIYYKEGVVTAMLTCMHRHSDQQYIVLRTYATLYALRKLGKADIVTAIATSGPNRTEALLSGLREQIKDPRIVLLATILIGTYSFPYPQDIVKAGGVKLMMNVVTEHIQDADTIGPACGVLLVLTTDCPDDAIRTIAELNGASVTNEADPADVSVHKGGHAPGHVV